MHKKISAPLLLSILVTVTYVAHVMVRHTGVLPVSGQGKIFLAAANGGGNGGGAGGANGNNGGGNGGGTGGDNGNNGGGNGGGTGGGNGGNNGNNGGGNGGGNGGDNGNNGGGRANAEGQQGGGGGGDRPSVQGRGLRQHAAVLSRVLGLKATGNTRHTYLFKQHKIHTAGFGSKKEEKAWNQDLHEVTCSMFRYLRQLREDRPRLRTEYVDWVVYQTANALGEDPVEVRAALLGFPHHHEHTSDVLQTITKEGCSQSSDVSREEREKGPEEHALHVHSTEPSSRFTVDDRSTDTDIVFQVKGDEAVFQDFGRAHTKEMHVIVVRDDLRYFTHLHPGHDAEGTWRTPFIPPAGGKYWVYADFVDTSMNHSTVKFARSYAADPGVTGFVPDTHETKRVGKYNVTMQKQEYSDGVILTFRINDDRGRDAFLEPYLGAVGHGILISPEGDFIHTHPSVVDDHLTLHLPNDLHGTYRVFTQFQVQGEVLTAVFDWVTDEDEDAHPAHTEQEHVHH